MICKNEEYECEILSNGVGGEGVCRIDGFAVFVPDTVKGDIVRIKILKVKSSYAFGKAVEILEASPNRAVPLCSRSGSCGGCDIASMDYGYQLELKRNTVIDALSKIGGIKDIEVDKTVGMETPYFYRNKMQFPVGRDRNGKITYGFYAKHSHNIISASECVTGKKHCKTIMETVVRFMEEKNIEPYDEQSHTGLVRHVFIRDSASTGEIMVVIVINGMSMPGAEELAGRIVASEKSVSGIILNINKKKTNLIMGDKNILIYGSDRITDKIGHMEFSISPQSFYQINSVQTEKLYNLALEAAGEISNKTVFDLYCGTGTITLFMAQKAKKVYGIEIAKEAVKNARENAARNSMKNAEFYCGPVENVIGELYNKGITADVVVLDPPRKGSDQKTLDVIVKMNPEKIVYVSCNPATLARDVIIFTQGGYNIQKVTPVDMFPQTAHVECVCLLTRNKD